MMATMPAATTKPPAQAPTTVIVTAWRHGPHVLGRVTLVPSGGEAPSSKGKACRSVDEICAEVRALVVGEG